MNHIAFIESQRSTIVTHASKLKVAKPIDGYLAKIGWAPKYLCN